MKTFRSAVILASCAAWLLAQGSSGKHAERAAEFAQRGDLKSAEIELRKAIELTPSDPRLLTSLGGILGMEGDLAQGNVYLAKAVKLNPNDPLLRRNLAANEWQLGRFRQAQENLELLLRANPADKGAVFLLGMVSENEKNYTRSIALLESIPGLVEHQPEASVALARSYYHTDRGESARSALKKLLGRSVKDQVMLMGARVAMEAHDYALALQIAVEAAERFPDSYEVFLTKAAAEIELRYFSQAVDSARRAAGLHPSMDTRRTLAVAEWRAGARNDANSEFGKVLREFPRDAGIYETYGTLLLENASAESETRAIELLKKAVAINDSSSEAHYQLANIELADGHFETALKHLERAIQANPNDSRLHFALSRVYRRLGRNADADREIDKYQKLKAAHF